MIAVIFIVLANVVVLDIASTRVPVQTILLVMVVLHIPVYNYLNDKFYRK